MCMYVLGYKLYFCGVHVLVVGQTGGWYASDVNVLLQYRHTGGFRFWCSCLRALEPVCSEVSNFALTTT